jgi:hypothetical protein
MANLLCRIGIHRWDFASIREGDNLVTWGWCRRIDCPHFVKPRVVDIEWRPQPDEETLRRIRDGY